MCGFKSNHIQTMKIPFSALRNFRKTLLPVTTSAGIFSINDHYQDTQKNQKAASVLRSALQNPNPNQLPSVTEFLNKHFDSSYFKEDVKTVLTEDVKTFELAEEIISKHAQKEGFSEEAKESLKKIITEPKSARTDEKGSIDVVIAKIEGTEFEDQLMQQSSEKKKMICVGGPAAVDQALLASTIPQIAEKTDVVYVGAGHWYSNLVNSALQVHARHGNALNADDSMTGHALLAIMLARGVIGIVNKTGEAEDAVENPDYRKIHVKFTLDAEKLGIYLGNEANWLKQKIVKNFLKKPDQHDLNRLESVVSAEIMYALQDVLSETLGRKFSIIEGNKRDNLDSSSIHVALSKKEVEETKTENKILSEIGIASVELSREEIEKLFGKNNQIFGAFSYPGDGNVVPQYHVEAGHVVKEMGNEWLEPAMVTKIFVKKVDDDQVRIAGVLVQDNDEQKFISADHVHFSGGYMVNLQIEDSAAPAISSPTTTATGVSSNVILERNSTINNFINRYGNTGQLAVTNSHWTMLAKSDSHVILRVTGGGNTGSEAYNPNYFLNNIANTVRIFSDENSSPLVGIVRSYGCPRSINAINATSFEKLAEGFLVSYGKGGTGNTKRFAEAVIALAELGFEEEVVSYFSKFKTAQGDNLGHEITKIISDFRSETAFLSDSTQRLGKEIGYFEKTIFDLNVDETEIPNAVLSSIITGHTASQLQGKKKQAVLDK